MIDYHARMSLTSATLLRATVLVLVTALVMAQTPAGQIVGVVQDPSGSLVSGATVIVTNTDTGQSSRLVSDDRGEYVARQLLPGSYSVTTEAAGFKQAVRKGITVTALQNVRVDFTLELGATTQSVVVTRDAPLVETRTGALGALLDDRRIVDLPVRGRNIVNLAALLPGVTRTSAPDTTDNTQQRININGNRAYSTNMQLDGGSTYHAFRGGSMILPPPDAIQEVKIVSSGVSAEYGRGNAFLTAVTKSGSNSLHGSLWDYFRNNAMDARSFFTPTLAKLRYNQFGGSVGGPVIHDRLFFFGSYQGLKIRQDASNTSAFPPTEAERQGDFSASNPVPNDPLTGQPFPNRIIPATRLDPVVQKLLQRIVTPNDPTGRRSSLVSQPADGHNLVGRVDWLTRASDRLSFRFYRDWQDQGYAFPPPSNVPGYSPGVRSMRTFSTTLTHLHTWSPSLITSSRITQSRFRYVEDDLSRTSLADLGARFVNGGATPKLPRLEIPGRFSAGPSDITPRESVNWDAASDWTWVQGRHEWKFGFQFLRHYYFISNDTVSGGHFRFDGTRSRNAMADFLLGLPVVYYQTSDNGQGGQYYLPAFYVQDNFRASRRLTLNLGLRWEVYTPWRENRGQQAVYIPGVQSRTFPTAPAGVVYQDDPQFPYNTDGVNIGPRIGFAWDVFGDGRTAVRGGYSVTYDGIIAQMRLNGNQPFSLNVEVNNPGSVSDPFGGRPIPFPYVPDPSSANFVLPMTLDTHIAGSRLEAMYNHGINFTIERQLGRQWMFQTSYVANLTRKALNFAETNPALYQPGATTANAQQRRLFGPNFTGMRGQSSDANAAYHGWQNLVQKRFSHGFTLVAHYTWAKGVDDSCTSEAQTGCRQQDPFNRRGSRGPTDFDQTHVAVLSYIYELPFLRNSSTLPAKLLGGWRLAGMNRFDSGTPVTVLTGRDASLTAVNNDRPDVLGSPELPGDRSRDEKLAMWFNTSAFRANAPGTYGNAGRNIIRGPGGIAWDLSLHKRFAIREGHGLEFRSEFFNVMNHPVFGNPQVNLNAPQSFGRITSASGGRVTQLALRYEF